MSKPVNKPVSLLAKAQAAKRPRNRPPDRDTAKLAVAWAADAVSYSQVRAALECSKDANVYATLAAGLRDAFRLGLLVKA